MAIELKNLWQRHPGLTQPIGDGYFEAACVCYDRHHAPPQRGTIVASGETREETFSWVVSDDRTRRAWANDIDATEAGAYCVSLAVVEEERGLVAVHRMQTRTGADYFVIPKDAPIDSLEDGYRLEVSGVDAGGATELRQRLRAKLNQAAEGESAFPALAAVVGFKSLTVLLAELVQE